MIDQPAQPESRPGPDHATIFIWLFALSSLWHYTSSTSEIVWNWFRFDPVGTPLTALAIVTAFIAAVFPNRTPAVLLFAGAQLLGIAVRFPFVADHRVMELLVNGSIIATFLYLAVRRRSMQVSTSEMFALYAPVGRWLLIVMYFYGTFHKINPGFMTLESSCAIPFIMGFPLPDALLDHPATQYAAIYGTLILEALAMVLLLSARTKYFGMLLGMTFHLIIGISSTGTLAHFSAFALALHALFLPSTFGQQLYADPRVPAILRSADAMKVATVAIVGLQLLFAVHLYVTYESYMVNLLFALFASTLMIMVLKHGQIRPADNPYRLKSPLPGLNAVPILFVLYCASPYVGLGTGGSLAMFSGLRTEGGVSNHYIIRQPVDLFSYQDEVLYVESAINPSLLRAADDNQGIVLWDFQRHFQRFEQLILPLTVVVDGTRYELHDDAAAQRFAAEYFRPQSWLERKYMSFRLVDDFHPDRCRH